MEFLEHGIPSARYAARIEPIRSSSLITVPELVRQMGHLFFLSPLSKCDSLFGVDYLVTAPPPLGGRLDFESANDLI